MTHLDTLVQDALNELRATPSRSEAQVIAESPTGGSFTISMVLGAAMMLWAFVWPPVQIDVDGFLSLNAILGAGGMLLLLFSFVLHAPGVSFVAVHDLPVSPVRMSDVFLVAASYPETGEILNEWVCSGHPLRRGQLAALERYAYLRRAQVSADRLRTRHARPDVPEA